MPTNKAILKDADVLEKRSKRRKMNEKKEEKKKPLLTAHFSMPTNSFV